MEAYYWLIIMAVFLVAEALTVNLRTIWFAAGALVAFVVALFTDNFVIQVSVFAVVSLVLLASTKTIVEKWLRVGKVKTNVDAVVGRSVYVSETISNLKAQGRVLLDGMPWTARSASGEEISEGTLVKVVQVSGAKLIVEPVRETE